MKTEKTQIHFLGDVIVVSLDLKVPIGSQRSSWETVSLLLSPTVAAWWPLKRLVLTIN